MVFLFYLAMAFQLLGIMYAKLILHIKQNIGPRKVIIKYYYRLQIFETFFF
jgi:hypothetical protein